MDGDTEEVPLPDDCVGCGDGETDPTIQLHRPSEGWFPKAHHLNPTKLWSTLQDEAEREKQSEPALASFLHASVLSKPSLERATSHVLAQKMADETLLPIHLDSLFMDLYERDPSLADTVRADLEAVRDRDPAAESFVQILLFFKGFQAVQAYRLTHALWMSGRQALALALQNRISEVFHVDIHPAARIGRGIMMDHATGIVIGETAVVGDNVSMLHHVTLGGSGTGRGRRHPRIGHGVLLGAGVCVLGPVAIGDGAKVGAGSVVVSNVPHHSVAVGVPARLVRGPIPSFEPVEDMDQTSGYILDFVI